MVEMFQAELFKSSTDGLIKLIISMNSMPESKVSKKMTVDRRP